MAKNLLAMQGTRVQSLSQEDPLEEGMATHSNILAWEIPWTEEPGGLQFMRSQRVRHDWKPKKVRLWLITFSYGQPLLRAKWRSWVFLGWVWWKAESRGEMLDDDEEYEWSVVDWGKGRTYSSKTFCLGYKDALGGHLSHVRVLWLALGEGQKILPAPKLETFSRLRCHIVGESESVCCLVMSNSFWPQSMEFSRQEYWSGLPYPPPGLLPTQGLNPGLLHCRSTLYHLGHHSVS